MAIIVVGNFLRDLKSNYLEGALCILVYLIIAVRIATKPSTCRQLTQSKVAAFYYPNPNLSEGDNSSEGTSGGEGTAAATTEAALHLLSG